MSEMEKRGRDRGRGAIGYHGMENGNWIKSFRATPTTEVEEPPVLQPFYLPKWNAYVVHNGVIANDKELGNREGHVDSEVLTSILDLTNLKTFRYSLLKIVGSYAIIVMMEDKFYLACNYKPLWLVRSNRQFYISSMKRHFSFLQQATTYLKLEKIEPYTCIEIYKGSSTRQVLKIPRQQPDKALVVASGGLDSTAVAAYANAKHESMTLLHYDYGCHATSRERDCIEKIAEYLRCGYIVLPLSYAGMAKSTLLQKGAEIAEAEVGAEYGHEWVPARNLVMLSIAVAYAEANGYGHIYLGVNLEEAGNHPDNEEQFIEDFNNCLYGAVQNGIKVEVHAPIGNLMKTEIIEFGQKYNAPFHLTYSCYKGAEKPCGVCSSDFMRRTAFKRNGLVDPLEYESDGK